MLCAEVAGTHNPLSGVGVTIRVRKSELTSWRNGRSSVANTFSATLSPSALSVSPNNTMTHINYMYVLPRKSELTWEEEAMEEAMKDEELLIIQARLEELRHMSQALAEKIKEFDLLVQRQKKAPK